jgi:hypothetical protein
MTVICPNCGGEITAPKKKAKTIKCPHCDMAGLEFGLDYFDEEDNPKQSFFEKHPKLTKAGYATFAGACTLFVWWLKNKDLFTEEPTTECDSIGDSRTKTFPGEYISPDPVQENTPAPVNPEDYDSVLRKHGLSIRNMRENRFHSPEKEEQANAIGIKLKPNQTLVNEFSQHYRVKKQEA